jgi:hypothetical protein
MSDEQPSGTDVKIIRGTEWQTVHLPGLLPTDGSYTFRTGELIRIEPGFQEVEIRIRLVPKPKDDP